MRRALARLASMSKQDRDAFLAQASPVSDDFGAAVRSTPSARPRPDGRSPASFGQQQQLFLDQLWTGDTAAYLVPFALHLRGQLSIPALRESMRDVVARHRVLASRFSFEDGSVFQVVDSAWQPELEVVPIDGDTAEERARAAEAYGIERARSKFDAQHGPLLRTELLRLSDEDHVLLWIAHHAVADGWSVGILIGELSAAYQARVRGQLPELQALQLEFADFAEWQREQLGAPDYAERVEKWRRRLANVPAATLPVDHERPAVQTFRGDSVPFMLPKAVSDGVAELTQRTSATPFAVLLSALQVLLSRYSGDPDTVIGVVLTGRARTETEPLIGPFANTLPLRIDATGPHSFAGLVDQVMGSVLDGLADQELPFGHLVKELGGSRDTSRNPLYQVLFSMGSLPLGSGEIGFAPGVTLRPVGLSNGTSRLDLEVTMEQLGDRLAGRIDYNTDLYDPMTIDSLIARFSTLLAAVVADPDRRLGEYALEPEEVQDRALRASAEPAEAPLATGFLELLATQVAKQPRAAAVRCGPAALSYRVLDERSNAIAHAIRSRTTAPVPVVAVATGRSIDLLPTILGILKAGGVYLPLELEYPTNRLAYMVADSAAELVITAGAEHERLAALGVPVLDLGEVPGAAPPVGVPHDLDRLVYIMYTSGSTGRPKGLAVTHRALANFLGSMAERGVMVDGDVTLALASLPFDGSVIELFLPLAVGACVVVGQRSDARDGSRLRELMDTYRVSVQHGTPSTWRMLLDAGSDLAGLRIALSGGEALPAGLAGELRERVPAVWNLYGPAETTVYSLAQPLREDSTPLVGSPIAGTTVQVLDELMRPVPAGVLGELFIGGAGVAQGYLNLPELTAERFVIHPVTGKRLYRTGDLFRQHPDGSLTFHGRRDYQVKIRGHRIELGEIESALGRCEGVRDAVVLSKDFGNGDQRLVGYVRAIEGTARLAEAGLKLAAKAWLPEYMIPSRIACLPEFPLNSSGKIDRRALHALELTDADEATQYDAPTNATEEWLAQLWAALLGRDRVGIHEDFFGAGGHSLLAVQLVHRVRDQRGVEIGLDVFFGDPTIAGQAERIDKIISPRDFAEIERQVDAMTDDEVSALLALVS
jgi:amino acid adenylation domain-containing protein